MSNYKPIVLGERPKLSITMSPIADAYSLAAIDWRVEFYASRGSVVITKEQAERIDDNTYAVRVDTLRTGTGKLCGILFPCIPDNNMPEGYYAPPVPFDTAETIVSPYWMKDGLPTN